MAASSSSTRRDVAIIGAGPVGLFAVFECGMLKMSAHVIDTLDAAGGQCLALYPEKPIYDIPGYPKIGAAELIDRLVEQAAPFKPEYHLGKQVQKLARASDDWALTLSDGSTIQARAVIVAAGGGAFGPNRPPLAGIEAYEGKSVHYLVRKREDFRGKRIVIAGGGDSAVDWTLSLADVARHITVVHRRDKFRAAPESVAQMKALAATGKVEFAIPYQLDALEGSGGVLSAVKLKALDGTVKSVPADSLLAFFGLAMNLGPIAEWSLKLDQNRIAVTPATCESSQAGVFAIGDIATYPGKLKLILAGFSEAASAAHAIYPLAHPGQVLHFEYSTTQGVPGA